MRKRLLCRLGSVAAAGLVLGIGGSMIAPPTAEGQSAAPLGVSDHRPQLAQSADETSKVDLESSQLANENTYLRTELEKVSGKVEVLETEIKQLKEKTSVDPFLAGVYPVDTELGLKLAQIHFDIGSAELSPGASRRILAVADWVTKEGIGEVTLVGISDSSGPADKNLELSKARAASVATLLERHGLSKDIIKVDARGEGFQIEETTDNVSEPLNRCVGIFVDPSKAKGKVSQAQ